jgi:hypothetical protein
MGLFPVAPTVSNIIVAIVLVILALLILMEVIYWISDSLRAYYGRRLPPPEFARASAPEPGPGPGPGHGRVHRRYQSVDDGGAYE